jgi:hypothetical protein
MVNMTDRRQYRRSLVLRSFCQLSRSYFASEKSWEFVIEALPFGCLWYAEPNAVSNAIDYARSSPQFATDQKASEHHKD